MKKVLLISSTGGHLTELLQLKQLADHYDCWLITENTAANKDLAGVFGADRFDTLVFGTSAHLFSYPFKFAWNCIKSWALYLKIKPDVVITTGTHTAVPMCKIAHWHQKKVIWIETMANSRTATKSGKMIYPIADLFIVQWKSMLSVYPNAVYGGWVF
ncbi:MAG: polysaccharide biosynthesis protein [Erysipelotrichia bacterium]|nr:polysaccharide biosynthesis protein [Erysipelotrichia bacterium]